MKLDCECGHQISTVSFPCIQEAHLITDHDRDDSANYGEKPFTYKQAPSRHVYLCDVEYEGCGRLFVETQPGSNKYTVFAPVRGEFLHFGKTEE